MRSTAQQPIRLGHVHLKVQSLTTALAFYKDLLGFEITEVVGDRFAFLSAGGAHHELALQALGPDALPPQAYQVGLYHTAFEVASIEELLAKWNALQSAGYQIAAVDHGISWALYLNDPDGNGVEVYLDRRSEASGREDWKAKTAPLSKRMVEAAREAKSEAA